MRSVTRTALATSALACAAVGVLLAAGLLPGAAQAATSASQVTSSTVRSASAATIYGNGPLLSTNTSAAKQSTALAQSDPAGAAAARTLAGMPTAIWLGEWTTGSTLTNTLDTATAAAAAHGTTAVFVTYLIPDRDCGGYSAGGFTESQYDAWVDQIASTLQGTRSVVLVEPDSLAELSDSTCSSVDASDRYAILSREVNAFTAAGVPSYLDAGDSNWVPPATMASRLEAAGVANARGFFSNVSDYYPTAAEQAYDEQVAADIGGGVHYVIDTSRNGQGWKGTWCNAPGAGLGESPRVVGDGSGLDALLYVKTPGESDGECNGGPAAGDWFSSYAEALVANAQTGSAAPTAPTANAAATPTGHVDAASVVPGGIAVRGWALDRTSPATALTVAVTEDGKTVSTTTASASRPDVDRAYHDGPNHGYSVVVAGAAGKHTVCAVATNAAGATPTKLGCAAVTVPASGPVGRIDSATAIGREQVVMRGWAFDRDSVGSPVQIQIIVNGKVYRTTVANTPRPDVAAAYSVGASHGYSIAFAIVSGKRSICVTAVNIGSGSNTSLGCRTVVVP